MRALAIDPVTGGLVDELARPGGNVTGITNLMQNWRGNGWSCSKKPFPKLARVAVLYGPAIQGNCTRGEGDLPSRRARYGVQLQRLGVRAGTISTTRFRSIGKQRPMDFSCTVGSSNRANRKTDRGLCIKVVACRRCTTEREL